MVVKNSNPNTDILKFLPSHYSTGERTFLWALLKAINGSNQKLEELIQACIDQLFLSTAQGRYLVQLGEQQGFTMPQNSGLDIRAYRTLVPIMVADPKQIRQTIEEIIKAFYLSERVKPNLQSTIVDPFTLQDGDDLIIETQSTTVKVAVTTAQVNDLNNVTAAELAAIINSSQSEVLADTPVDRSSARNFLRVTSSASGASANIRIAGGKLQNVLKFPELVNTAQQIGTSYNLTKSSVYTDELKFEWDGVGINPKLYNLKPGDVVTIRGLIDGVDPFSLLNGSYEIVDCGYNYFIIRNDAFDSLSAFLVQPADNSLMFTSSRKLTIYDRDEYAVVSENDVNTVTVTVPAVPPLARRFLSGATHLRGAPLPVLDFTRNSLQVLVGTGFLKPAGDNWFHLTSNSSRFDFRKNAYKTTSVDTDDTQPTYVVSSGDNNYSALPFTTATPTGITNPIFGEVDSEEFLLNFNFNHGLNYPWGFTLSGATGAGNILAGDLNKEHVVFAINNQNQLRFRIFDSLTGIPKKFQGFTWGPADLYQFATSQPDGADFYLEFPNPAAAIASGLVPGMSLKLDVVLGTDVDPYIAGILRYRKMTVTSVVGDTVRISTGYGVGPFGLIIDDVEGYRSGDFGGTISYFFDKTSSYNQANVLDGLRAILYGYSTPQNPNFTNSYLYDPTGATTKVTVSKFIVRTTDKIFKGDNLTAIEVDVTSISSGEELAQSGEIVLGYGTDQFEGPIRYYAVVKNPGNNQILIDPAYRFKFTHDVGTQVQVIHQRFPFTPGIDGSDYPCYVTGTTTSRETMFLLIELLVAAGIFVEREVIKPDLRYDDTEITVFD